MRSSSTGRRSISLTAVRGPGESYSDVILRLAKGGYGLLPVFSY
jgi:hypothetical protein